MFPERELDLAWDLTLLAVTALGLLAISLVAMGLVLFARWIRSVVVSGRLVRTRRMPASTGLAADNSPRYPRIFILLPVPALIVLAVVLVWSLARDPTTIPSP
jgi:hypothetical protein